MWEFVVERVRDKKGPRFKILEDEEDFGAINRFVISRFPNHGLLGLNNMDLNLIC